MFPVPKEGQYPPWVPWVFPVPEKGQLYVPGVARGLVSTREARVAIHTVTDYPYKKSSYGIESDIVWLQAC